MCSPFPPACSHILRRGIFAARLGRGRYSLSRSSNEWLPDVRLLEWHYSQCAMAHIQGSTAGFQPMSWAQFPLSTSACNLYHEHSKSGGSVSHQVLACATFGLASTETKRHGHVSRSADTAALGASGPEYLGWLMTTGRKERWAERCPCHVDNLMPDSHKSLASVC